jgi:serine/threonine-protein kinase
MTDSTWRLALLGRLDLTGSDPVQAERILVQPKHLALLIHLVLEAREEAPVFRRRDELATLLWPELDQAHARASLRRVVHQIRAALGPEILLSRGDEELAVNPALFSSDVADFTRAIANGQLVSALEFWKGDPMPGFHVSDCAELGHRFDDARAELRQEAGAAAWALAKRLEETNEPSQAARWARRVPRFAQDDERVLRRALTMLDRLGDRAGALRVYDEFARRLKAEFDAEPSTETIALVTKIRGLAAST